MTILDEILAHKREEIARRKAGLTERDLLRRARERSAQASFSSALRAARMGLIAEVKRRSPSAGAIREPFDPVAIARAYAGAGASAVSVLMDEKYFGGGEKDFRAVRRAVSLPLLYKEFVVDSWQIRHAAAMGASAVLLIAAALSDHELKALSAACRATGLEALVEVHDEFEMRRAASIGARLIGINNRDLRTFRTDVSTSLRLAAQAPPDALLVSESGIREAEELERLHAAGFRAVLVGETLLRKPDPAAAIQELFCSFPLLPLRQ